MIVKMCQNKDFQEFLPYQESHGRNRIENSSIDQSSLGKELSTQTFLQKVMQVVWDNFELETDIFSG